MAQSGIHQGAASSLPGSGAAAAAVWLSGRRAITAEAELESLPDIGRCATVLCAGRLQLDADYSLSAVPALCYCDRRGPAQSLYTHLSRGGLDAATAAHVLGRPAGRRVL